MNTPRPLIFRPHLRESEITCLPSIISMNAPKQYDAAAHIASLRVPTIDKPPIAVRRTGRPRIKPVKPKKVIVRKSELILGDDYLKLTAKELAAKHNCDISYVRWVIRQATGEPPRVKTPPRGDDWYIAIAKEHKDGASRPALKGKYGLNNKQLSYALIKGKALASEGSLIGGIL